MVLKNRLISGRPDDSRRSKVCSNSSSKPDVYRRVHPLPGAGSSPRLDLGGHAESDHSCVGGVNCIMVSRSVSNLHFVLRKRFKGRAADPDGASVLVDRTPRRHEAGGSVKAWTAAALITDHERKAVAARVPYFHVLDRTSDAGELHGHSHLALRHRLELPSCRYTRLGGTNSRTL